MQAYDWRNPERVVPWKPRHRFAVTASGRDAIEGYHRTVTEAQQSADPRAELDAAKKTWADQFKLRPSDGIILDELTEGRVTLADMSDALAACDLSLRDARGAVDRLLAAGLIESLEPIRP
jgi:hypothetical protein